ncbi:MAG: hypothetical protein EA425_01785 [Puniceicoccaceae bacterium]|nr:MAG: hypothetical protein EA425_01785 [Puniceicoccaceae bacterium]
MSTFQLPALVIDAASPESVAGILRPDRPACWQRRSGQTMDGLFEAVAAVLADSGTAWTEIRTVLHCRGPGTQLGLRIAIMALRIWREAGALRNAVFQGYSSLGLTAQLLLRRETPPPFEVTIDARRQSWYVLTVRGPEDLGAAIERRPLDVPGPAHLRRFSPECFPRWSQPEPPPDPVAYQPEALNAKDYSAPLLRQETEPTVLNPDPATFRQWTPPALS